jgi:NAD(P)-dependent dehydrogenase (short-subunit alcohol dehydrogenase family)
VSSTWALRGFGRVAALELAADRIRVNSILPGPVLGRAGQPARTSCVS